MNEDIIKPEKKKKAKHAKTGKYGKFNVLDALIIFCVLALAALLIFVYSPLKLFGFGTEQVDIIYTVRISGVPADYASMISIGDPVKDSNGHDLGRVASNVEVQEHFIYEYREDEHGSGGIVQIQHPELVDIIVTVLASADKSDEGYFLDGKRLAVESVCELVCPNLEATGICLSMSEENINEAGGAK
ncbi:MAG: DUF4330 domain-containing protein [Eubacteriales bacterium]